MNIYQYFDYLKQYIGKDYNCEIIIGCYGEIELALPRHEDKMLEMSMKKDGITNLTVEEYYNKISFNIPTECSIRDYLILTENYVCVYPCYIACSKRMNRFQRRVLLRLNQRGILPNDTEFHYIISPDLEIKI